MSDDYRLTEELRPQIPEWFFGVLCWSGPPGSWRRRWMLWPPFRQMLFRKLHPAHDCSAVEWQIADAHAALTEAGLPTADELGELTLAGRIHRGVPLCSSCAEKSSSWETPAQPERAEEPPFDLAHKMQRIALDTAWSVFPSVDDHEQRGALLSRLRSHGLAVWKLMNTEPASLMGARVPQPNGWQRKIG